MPAVISVGASALKICTSFSSFTIHSVFNNVMNLAAPDNSIISLCRNNLPDGPASLITSLQAPNSWLTLGFHPGEPVTLSEHELRLPRNLVISGLANARIWNPLSAEELPRPHDPNAILDHIKRLSSTVSEMDASEGFSSLIPIFGGNDTHGVSEAVTPFAAMYIPTIRNLYKSIAAGDPEGVSVPAAALAGAGPGLTPSGDDLLSGLMLSLTLACKIFRFPPDLPHALCSRIYACTEGKTNSISRHFLRYSADGIPDELSQRCILSLLSGSFEAVRQSAGELCRVGSSSGKEQLLGIILGIRAVLEQTSAGPFQNTL